MSELSATQRMRRRRSEARRSIEAVLDAAVTVLSEQPEASVADVARSAGVTRQTVYAHFPSREALVSAAIDRATDEAVAAMDAADLDYGPPAVALLRLMDAGWRIFERYPLLLRMAEDDPHGDERRHQPVLARLERLVKRGQEMGDFDPQLSPAWLTKVAVALGHAAGEQVAAGHMTTDEATAALRLSVLRVFGADAGPTARPTGR